MKLSFTKKERKDLLLSWLVISAAFAIVLVGFKNFSPVTIAYALGVSLVTVGLGFIAHELAHKYLAMRYDCFAEYKADKTMLLVALVTSLFGIVIAAPGAVHVSGRPSRDERGRVSAAGPAANLVLAALFLLAYFLLDNTTLLARAAGFGAVINTWLGLFNLLPFGVFDGAKVFSWHRTIYFVLVAVGVVMAFIQVPLGLF